MKRIYELCKLLGINTFEDLRRFEDEYRLEMPTTNKLIAALEKEVFQ